MIQSETKIRILYGDTDKMGVVYYGNYPRLYEAGRTELMRELGYSYDSVEKAGVMMPVVEMHIEYFKSAFYDDLVTIKTYLKELPGARIRFYYELYNEKGDLLNKAYTDLSFINADTYRPVRPPRDFYEFLKKYFE